MINTNESKTDKKKQKTPRMILPGQLVPTLDELYAAYVTEVYENTEIPNVLELIKMFRFCPVNRISVEFKSM